MTWVRRTEQKPHVCAPPMRKREPVMLTDEARRRGMRPPPETDIPDGYAGDLWRCDCGKLWRVATVHNRLTCWEPAPWWLRWKYRNEGRTPRLHPGGVIPTAPIRLRLDPGETVIKADTITWRYPEGRNET